MTANAKRVPFFCASDLVFLLLAAIFSWLALRGVLPLSGWGAVMDSDLETYAQGMAGAAMPDFFKQDPALSGITPANSIPNLQRALGSLLAPAGEWATGLLRAGAAAILVFYVSWYFLGRRLYNAPSLAALLAVLSGITVWVGWGTFWGVLHSDPVPRVFFAALFPWLLLLALKGIDSPAFRPAALLAAGLAMWVHGVSALNCGAMFFTAFFFLPAPGSTPARHIRNLVLCLAAFMGPAIFFLWPSLAPGSRYGAEELAVFNELFHLRWQEDYAGFFTRIAAFFSPFGPVFPILAGGVVAWLVLRKKASRKEAALCRAYPFFALGLFFAGAFCWIETRLAPDMGRIPMGHELIRGLRFLIPLSWMLICGAAGVIFRKTGRRVLLGATCAAVLLLSADRQYMAAQYAIYEITGLRLPLAEQARAQKSAADVMRELFGEIARIVPKNEEIYCPVDAMPIRYMALRPLAHSFKDGYLHFYNKDAAGAKRWLELEKLAKNGASGWRRAWLESGAPWLLLPPGSDRTIFLGAGAPALEAGGWILVKKEADANTQGEAPAKTGAASVSYSSERRLKAFLPAPQTGHFQSSGRSSKLVPGGILCLLSPLSGS